MTAVTATAFSRVVRRPYLRTLPTAIVRRNAYATLPAKEKKDSPANAIHQSVLDLKQPGDEFWRKIPRWADVPPEKFISHSWSVSLSRLISMFLLLLHLFYVESCCWTRLIAYSISDIQSKQTIQGVQSLFKFIREAVPDEIPFDQAESKTQSKDDFLEDFKEGVKAATMAIRIT